MYKVHQIMSDIYILEDQAKYCSTLVIGKDKALLWDTGCGLDDLKATVEYLTDLPLIVICSHAHFDHIGGSIQFNEVYLNKAERINLKEYTDERLSDWLTNINQEHKRIEYHSNNWLSIKDLDFRSFDLGNIKCEIIDVPGHSIGEVLIYIPERRLIISGDCMLPVMSLIFDYHSDVLFYKKTLERINNIDFDYYLTSHITHKLSKSTLNKMIECLEESKNRKFLKYKYNYPPFKDGYINIYSMDEDPVGLIVESLDDLKSI